MSSIHCCHKCCNNIQFLVLNLFRPTTLYISNWPRCLGLASDYVKKLYSVFFSCMIPSCKPGILKYRWNGLRLDQTLKWLCDLVEFILGITARAGGSGGRTSELAGVFLYIFNKTYLTLFYANAVAAAIIFVQTGRHTSAAISRANSACKINGTAQAQIQV